MQAIRRNPGAITAVTIGLLLLMFAGFEDDTRPYEVAQLAVGGALVLAGCALPYLRDMVAGRSVDGHCDPYELGQVETCCMDAIDRVERNAADAVREFAAQLAAIRESLDEKA